MYMGWCEDCCVRTRTTASPRANACARAAVEPCRAANAPEVPVRHYSHCPDVIARGLAALSVPCEELSKSSL